MAGVDRHWHRADVGQSGLRLVVFAFRRVLWTVPVLVLVVVTTFALVRLAPGSPWDQSHEGRQVVELSDAAVAHLEAKYGLDQPWWEQLAIYLGNVAQFDLGDSYVHPGREASELILEGLPYTVALGALALTVIVPVGIAAGVLAARRHGSLVDRLVTWSSTLGASVPSFVVGIVLILVFSVALRRATDGKVFLPAGGFGFDEHLLMPVVTLSLFPVAFLSRLTRSSTLEAMGQDHVRMARGKGLPERLVVVRHVLKNALTPVVTTLGAMFGFLITGTIVVETLFQVPGLGSTFVQAVSQRDYPVVLAGTIVYVVVVSGANLVVDIVYMLIDPRIRSG
jgi:oligopeptide transport system permease protein